MIHVGDFWEADTISCSFNDQEIVALCGAHALGRCHTDRYMCLRCISCSVTDVVFIQLGFRWSLDFLPYHFL